MERISRRIFLGIVVLYLAGCTGIWRGDSVTLELNKNYIERRLCLGLYEVEYPFLNGSGYASEEYFQAGDGKKFNSYNELIAYDSYRHKMWLRAYERAIVAHSNRPKNIEEFNVSKDGFDTLLSNDFDIDSYMNNFIKKIGMEPFKYSPRKVVRKKHLSPLKSLSLDNIESYYAPQKNKDVCWAASLETAFNYIGIKYKQEEFVSALKARCSTKLSKSATVNQMFFAATDRHINSGGRWISKFPKRSYTVIDFGELLKSFSPFHVGNNEPLPGHSWTGSTPSGSYSSLYATIPGVQVGQYEKPDFPTEEIKWTTTRKADGKLISKGKIKLIKSVSELILAMKHKYPVVAGFNQATGGHTVVISRIHFRPGGRLGLDNIYYLDGRSYLAYVYFLDPLYGPEAIGMSGPEFLDDAAFMFYIDP